MLPLFYGNINFNAQHAPLGAFMSFTCGQFGTGGGIGLELGRPANQNIYVGVKTGDRRSTAAIRCLPFVRGAEVPQGQPGAHYSVEHAPPAPETSGVECYDVGQIKRQYGWATDSWTTPDFTFTIHSPFSPIARPGVDEESAVRASLLPAVVATFEIDNRNGSETKTAVLALDWPEAGTRLLREEGEKSSSGRATRLGFAWRRSMGVLGMLRQDEADGLFAFQRWSVTEGISDVNHVHELGNCGGLAVEVPAGGRRTLVLAIGAYLGGVVTTGLEGQYLYSRYYAGLEHVLSEALDRFVEIRDRATALDAKLLNSGLSAAQQFHVSHGTRGYYGATQLLDVGGEPFWIVNEGEYCMMNTLDLSIDHAFWELEHNPWVVENLLTNFVRHYSYNDNVKSRPGPGAELLVGGLSFAHDMGVNNNFSRTGHSSYELAHLTGCFSYMTQEQLCNWILLAACYVAKTRDVAWLRANSHVIRACADSMRNRAHPRTGVMAHDSARCVEGQEITTYDSLDESLGQARANSYVAVKCWASWLGLEMLSLLTEGAGGDSLLGKDKSLADRIASFLTNSVGPDGTLPAVLERDNPGYRSRILPAAESLIYPSYWLEALDRKDVELDGADEAIELLHGAMRDPLIDTLKKHSLQLLLDVQRRNLFDDGGLKLSSTANNSWMSKIALFQHVARKVMHLHAIEPRVAAIFEAADQAHVAWQTDGSGFWACSDQFVNGVAKGSRYYPRVITAALWLDERAATNLTTKPSLEVSINTGALKRDLPTAAK